LKTSVSEAKRILGFFIRNTQIYEGRTYHCTVVSRLKEIDKTILDLKTNREDIHTDSSNGPLQ